MTIGVFIFVFLFLSLIQIKLENPLILLERFINGGGWIEIVIISAYGAFLAHKMQDPATSSRWRLLSWNIFSIVFFGQLILGIIADERFLMTGKLHLPVPMMILGGPLFRGEFSIMTILFLSTVLVTGPAWCSHLCYFGSIDNLAASRRKPVRKPVKLLHAFKFSLLPGIILVILLLRWLNVSTLFATIAGIGFGVFGIMIMLFFSAREGKMIHCLAWCPIGTIVNYARFINPFRMYIDKDSCTLCNRCTSHCRYDALNRSDIESGSPAITCTLCGDCVGSCNAGSIRYKFLRMRPEASRRLYIFLTAGFHSVFLALARI